MHVVMACACEHPIVATENTMRFAIKIKHKGKPARWDYFDDPRVNDNLDAAAFGKVMAEGWNNDLKPGEKPMKILNAYVIGPGKKQRTPAIDPRQLDLLRPNRRMQ